MRTSLVVVIALAACGSRDAPAPSSGVARVEGSATSSPTPAAPTGSGAGSTPTGGSGSEPAPTAGSGSAPAPVIAASGQDFIDDAKALYKIVGCTGEAMPTALSDPKHATAVER
ncbi:MAG: hypothetical protein H0V17_20695, partial [Deltaproteobacteria bacterium]|nr:hypothetical protein [Deltaproteobacteria bacterium]